MHGQWARLQRLNVGIRLAILAVLVGLVVLVQFINPVRNGLNSGLATINVTNHTDLTFADLITATCFVSIVELSPWIQIVLGNVVFRAIGRVTTAGLYLISAVMTFTAVPTLALSMSRNGSSPSSITGLTWLLMFGASFLLAIPFHFFIELPSKHFGERVRRSTALLRADSALVRQLCHHLWQRDGAHPDRRRSPDQGQPLARCDPRARARETRLNTLDGLYARLSSYTASRCTPCWHCVSTDAARPAHETPQPHRPAGSVSDCLARCDGPCPSGRPRSSARGRWETQSQTGSRRARRSQPRTRCRRPEPSPVGRCGSQRHFDRRLTPTKNGTPSLAQSAGLNDGPTLQ